MTIVSLVCFLLISLLIGGKAKSEHIPIYEPILITSAGQSFDVFIVKAALAGLGIETDLIALVQADQLEGYQQIIYVPGVSHKGLAAADLNFAQEKQRVRSVAEKAKEEGFVFVLIYLESFAPRDDRNQALLKLLAPLADYIVVYEGSAGPVDILYQIVEQKNIPLFYVSSIPKLQQEFQKLFQQ